MNCCCWHILFTQPDFVNQKSHLQEEIEHHSHLCDFYPKFHCKFNFIEQYWGAAKWHYWSSPRTNDMVKMEENVLHCLDDVPLIQIQQYVCLSLYFSVQMKLNNSIAMKIDLLSLWMLIQRV